MVLKIAIPDYFIQELKSRIDIQDVISSYVNLKRSGKNLVGLCPFHNEKTPSFSVSAENGYFHCFGCSAGGDAITFIRRIENLDYVEALKFLAERVGLEMPTDGVDDSMIKLRRTILEINRETARFYHTVLMSDKGKEGLEYLQKRGLSHKTIKTFGLGFAPFGKYDLVNHLKNKGFDYKDMHSANVANMYKDSNNASDRFYGRVMFPIIDLRGNVIAFGGRALGDAMPKYINTSETPVYHKSSGLFAMNFAKKHADKLILAEGYMDVIALHSIGFCGAVASLGTALTIEQSKIIAKYAKEVVICYDVDSAGQKATMRAIPILRQAGLNVRVLKVPGGKDPDEFIRSAGKDANIKFKAVLESCPNDIEYRLQKLKENIDVNTPEGKVEYLVATGDILASLDNYIERDVYAGRLSEELKVDKNAILNQAKKKYTEDNKKTFSENRRKEIKELSGAGDKVSPEKARNLRIANAEEALIAYMFSEPNGISYCKNRILPENFTVSFTRRVYQAVLGKDIGSNNITISDVSGEFSNDEISALTRILVKYSSLVNTQADADRYVDIILQDGAFSGADNIKNKNTEELLDYFEILKNKKLKK